jgi:uncharacterized protein YdcH (DUF465 family)
MAGTSNLFSQLAQPAVVVTTREARKESHDIARLLAKHKKLDEDVDYWNRNLTGRALDSQLAELKKEKLAIRDQLHKLGYTFPEG